MKNYEKECKLFRHLNKTALKDSVVLFGSSFANNIPVYELKQFFGISQDMYNRSVADLSIFDAKTLIDPCVTDIAPSKLLIQLGETDLTNDKLSIDEIISAYADLIKEIKGTNKHCKIVVISICAADTRTCEFNNRLEAMAKKLRCEYADISAAASADAPDITAFNMLRFFIPDDITLSDIMLSAV